MTAATKLKEVRERPILFSAPMVRAILEGRKFQTRRVLKPHLQGVWPERARKPESACPYGAPGDRLWVRETFYCDHFKYPNAPLEEMRELLEYRASHACSSWEAGCPCSDDEGRGAWRPSIHMPRWASRITLPITSVRVERLQDISEEDARAEGVDLGDYTSHYGAFANLWESINGEGSWDLNYWVWVLGWDKAEVRP